MILNSCGFHECVWSPLPLVSAFSVLPFPWADDPSPVSNAAHFAAIVCQNLACLFLSALPPGCDTGIWLLPLPFPSHSCQNIAEVKVCQVRTWQKKRGPSNRKVLLQNISKPSATITSHLKNKNLILLPNFLLTSDFTLCKQADLQICLCRTVHPESAGCVSTLLVIQMFFSAGIVLTVQHSAAAPWGVSLVTCLTSTALTPRWAEAHNIFMMPTQALSGWMCLSGECLWTFSVFLQGPCQRKGPSFFFFKEKCSSLYMKWMHLEQNCSVKSSIYSRPQMQVFKHLRLHWSTQRLQLSNIPCSAMPVFLRHSQERWERVWKTAQFWET